MNIDFSKACRIGIDRIVIYNIEFEAPKLPVFSIAGEDWIGEKIKITEELFTLEKTMKLKDTGEYTETTFLTLNPNKVLHGHNVMNSRKEELEEAFQSIKNKLKEDDVTLDLSKGIVSEIEININFQVLFSEYVQVLTLLFLNLQYLRKIGNHQESKAYRNLFKDATLDGGWQNHGARVYDKREEMKKYDKDLNFDLLRLEWWLLNPSYSYYAKKFGHENTLKALLDDDSIIDKIFRELSLNNLFKEAFEYLEKTIIPTLETEYLQFKERSKLAKKTGRKAPRSVYKYLEESCWIFDYQDLIELIKVHDKKHRQREIERIEKNYFHLNNKEKLTYLMEIILPH